jgi:5-methylcytosine-specific restriction protein A
MQNISATLYDMRLPHIAGYLPAKNVGSNVKEKIKVALESAGIEKFNAYIPTADRTILAQRVANLRKTKLGKVPPGSFKPEQIQYTSTIYVRDPAVKRWVLQVAAGSCEGCLQPAPFFDCDGFPYLEVHHVMPLASNGSDRICNAVALCPNCHRRCHYSSDRDEFKLALYERIDRLRIEVPTVEDEIAQFVVISP